MAINRRPFTQAEEFNYLPQYDFSNDAPTKKHTTTLSNLTSAVVSFLSGENDETILQKYIDQIDEAKSEGKLGNGIVR